MNVAKQLDAYEGLRRFLATEGEAIGESGMKRGRKLFREENRRPSHQLMFAWFDALEHPQHPKDTWRLGWLLAWILGAAVGAGAMIGTLSYDGGHPVNVFYVLAGFVLLQWLLLLLQVAAALNWIPVYSAVGRCMRWLRLDSESGGGQTLIRARALVWLNQQAGLSFALCSLLALIVMVTFRDYAFGWSTTLQADAERLHAWLTALAWPWQHWLPDAVPSLDTVRNTQFFRMAGTPQATQAAGVWGGWWSFLACCLGFYHVLPRVLMTLLAARLLDLTLRRQVQQDPALKELLHQLQDPEVYLGEQTEAHINPVAGQQTAFAVTLPEVQAVLSWSIDGPQIARISDPRVNAIVQQCDRLHFAGGGRSIEQDDATRAALADGRGNLLVLVLLGDAPIAELADMLNELDSWRIYLTPIELTGDLEHGEQREADLLSWQDFIARRCRDSVSLVLLEGPA